MQALSREVWQEERAQHRARIEPYTRERLDRSGRGEKHPVYDFLFEYYAFRPAMLLRYSPGVEVLLQEANAAELDWPRHFTQHPDGATLHASSCPSKRLLALRWTIRFLRATIDRPPVFHCFGLHEWAMVYRTDEVRHSRVPLRLADADLATFVESQQLCCTHFDAFRFFTPAAAPRNRVQLNRLSVTQMDQPGCIHANMDLYKWAFQLAPFVSSRLLGDTFEFASAAREIDMRASPYDLTSLGFAPIAIETKAGREEYVQCQRTLAERGQPLRARLLAVYELVERTVSHNASSVKVDAN